MRNLSPYFMAVSFFNIILVLSGCQNKERLAEKEHMLQNIYWLMRETDTPAPYKFDKVNISLEDCSVDLYFKEMKRIRELQSALSGKIPDDISYVTKTYPDEKEVGYLEVFSGQYSYKVPMFSSNSDLIFRIVIPGDSGGYSTVPLPGGYVGLNNIMKKWLPDCKD